MDTSALELKAIVKEWIELDTKLRTKQAELVAIRKEKTRVNNALMELMNAHQLDQLTVNNQKLYYKNRQVKKPVTAKYLKQVFLTYFEGNETKTQSLVGFVEQHREKLEKKSIHLQKNPSVNT
jgi:hypothetical protein